jgi:hypothetical protein
MTLIDRATVFRWRARLKRNDRPDGKVSQLQWWLRRAPRTRAWHRDNGQDSPSPHAATHAYEVKHGIEMLELFMELRQNWED